MAYRRSGYTIKYNVVEITLEFRWEMSPELRSDVHKLRLSPAVGSRFRESFPRMKGSIYLAIELWGHEGGTVDRDQHVANTGSGYWVRARVSAAVMQHPNASPTQVG